MKTEKEKNNLVMLNGHTSDTEIAKLEVEGKLHELKRFIISGETPEGKRLIFTWNASLDDILSYNYVLNICVEDKVRDALS